MALYDEFDAKLSGLAKRLGSLEKNLSDLSQSTTRGLSGRPDASAYTRLELAFQKLSKDFDDRVKYCSHAAVPNLQKTVDRLAKDLADLRTEALNRATGFQAKLAALQKEITAQKEPAEPDYACSSCEADLEMDDELVIETSQGQWCDSECLEQWLDAR